MDLANIKKGKEFKNFEALCIAINIEYKKDTKYRKKILEQLKSYCEYIKEGQKFTITKKYSKNTVVKTIKKKEIEKKATDKRGGNNKVFVDDLGDLLVHNLYEYSKATGRNEKLLYRLPTYCELSMVNDNFVFSRKYMQELSELTGVPLQSVKDFFANNSTRIRKAIEKGFEQCDKRRIIQYNIIKAVHIREANVVSNFTNSPIVIGEDSVLANVYDSYRPATDQERRMILKFEKEYMMKHKFKNAQIVFLTGNWENMQKYTRDRFKELGIDLVSYVDCYDIVWNNDDLEQEYLNIKNNIPKEELRGKINKNSIKSTTRSTQNRFKKPLKETDNPSLMYTKEDKYLYEQLSLADILIDLNAPCLKNDIKKLVDKNNFEKDMKIRKKNSKKLSEVANEYKNKDKDKDYFSSHYEDCFEEEIPF